MRQKIQSKIRGVSGWSAHGLPIPPHTVNGVEQDPIDGVSFAYTLADSKAKGQLLTQYFEIMGSRAIYHDNWLACAFGPRTPWLPGLPPGIHDWTPDNDVWELYNLEDDWSQSNDLAAKMPEKLAQMKEIFLIEGGEEQGASYRRRPLDSCPPPRVAYCPTLHGVDFFRRYDPHAGVLRTGPGKKNNFVTIDALIPKNANGVLYKLGGNSGGLTLFVEDGILCYEYNLFIIQRTKIRAKEKLPTGRVKIEITSDRSCNP